MLSSSAGMISTVTGGGPGGDDCAVRAARLTASSISISKAARFLQTAARLPTVLADAAGEADHIHSVQLQHEGPR